MKNILALALLLLTTTSHASDKATASDCTSTDGRFLTSSVGWNTSSGSVHVLDGKHLFLGATTKYLEKTSKTLEKNYREGHYGPIEDSIFTYDLELSVTTYEPDPQNPEKRLPVKREYGTKTMKCRSLSGDSREITYFGMALEYTPEGRKKLSPAMRRILAQFPNGGSGAKVEKEISQTQLSLIPVLSYEQQEEGLQIPASLVFKNLKLSVATRTIDPDDYFDVKFIFQSGDIVQLDKLDDTLPYCQLSLRYSFGSILKDLQGERELNGSNPITSKAATVESAPGLDPKVYYASFHAKNKLDQKYLIEVTCFPDMTVKQLSEITGGRISIQLNQAR